MIRIIADTRNAHQHWERRCDPIPYLIVPMSDGSTIRYNAEIPQPAPELNKKLDKFTKTCIGYERKKDNETDL